MSVPKLRFKEFDGDWEKTTLGEVVKFSNGKRVPLSETDRQKRQGKYRYYGASGVIDYVDDYLFDGQYILIGEDGANILTRSSTLAFVVEGKFWVNNHAHIFQSKKGDNTFLATYLESLNYEKYNSGTAQPKLNLENLKKVIVADPSKEEQTKIASFLSNVDEKISQLTQKHALLSQYKQGMMQKLFSQQLRFKADDGSEFGEWEKVKLGSLLIKHDEKTEFNNQYPVLTSSRHGIYFQKDYFAGQDVASADTTGYNVVPYDYFTYRHMSDDLVFKFNINTICPKGIVSTLYPVFTVKDEHLNKYFLQTILNEGQEFKNFAIMQKQGGSRTYMYFSKLSELVLTIPCLEEQTKIANFLSAIDQKIEVVTQQIEQAKQWKKGLLQQMFV